MISVRNGVPCMCFKHSPRMPPCGAGTQIAHGWSAHQPLEATPPPLEFLRGEGAGDRLGPFGSLIFSISPHHNPTGLTLSRPHFTDENAEAWRRAVTCEKQPLAQWGAGVRTGCQPQSPSSWLQCRQAGGCAQRGARHAPGPGAWVGAQVGPLRRSVNFPLGDRFTCGLCHFLSVDLGEVAQPLMTDRRTVSCWLASGGRFM